MERKYSTEPPTTSTVLTLGRDEDGREEGASINNIPNYYKNEYEFQFRLCSSFENPPFKHTCYLDKKREGYEVKTFSMEGTKRRIDIYMITNKKWQYHDFFPVIGIEVKLSKDMSHAVVNAFDQVKIYSEELPNANYFINYKQVPSPNIYLIVTPDSYYNGFIYQWNLPKTIPYTDKKIKDIESAWIGITETYQRLLMKHGAAVLRQNFFITNKWGNDSEKKWERKFELWM